MDRRELLALAGVAAAAGATIAQAQDAGTEQHARLIRIYTGPDGESHVNWVEIADDAAPIPVTSMRSVVYARRASSEPNWHTAPARLFAINMTGTLEVEVSDGSRQQIGPGDLVWLEDITGKGHVTRVLTPVTNLFIQVPQDWDMLAWSRGGATA